MFQFGPLKTCSGVGFPPRCNVLMSGQMLNRVILRNRLAQTLKAFILRRSEDVLISSFHLDTDRVIVAIVASPVMRFACMPCSLVATDKLQNLPASLDKEVTGYLHAPDRLEIRMSIPVQCIGEELLYFGTAKHTWRKRYGMDNHQVDICANGSVAEVG